MTDPHHADHADHDRRLQQETHFQRASLLSAPVPTTLRSTRRVNSPA